MLEREGEREGERQLKCELGGHGNGYVLFDWGYANET